MQFFWRFLFILSLTTCSSSLQAQNADLALANAEKFYQNKIKGDAFLFTGKEYAAYRPGLKGTPFFMTDTMQNGIIFYDANLYKNVPMLYDISHQQVVIHNYSRTALLQLLPEKIKYFIFNGHRFEKFDTTSNLESADAIGFYEIVFTGKASVLVKRQKSLKEGKVANDPNYRSAPDFFIENDVFFLRNGNQMFPVSEKNGVLNALEDRKSLVKKFLRKNHLRFKKNLEKDLITTATYYSSLN